MGHGYGYDSANYGMDFIRGMSGVQQVLANQDEMAEKERKRGEEADNRKRIDSTIDSLATFQTLRDSSIPNTPDEIGPAEESARAGLAAAEFLKQMPAVQTRITREQIPAEMNTFIDRSILPSVQSRAGAVHTDPTGKQYRMTGELGDTFLVESDGQGNTRVLPTMRATYEDGTVVDVPPTEGRSNGQDDPVKWITADQLYAKSAAVHHAIQTSAQNGTAPAAEYSRSLVTLVKALPYEEKVKWVQSQLSLHDKEIEQQREMELSLAKTAKDRAAIRQEQAAADKATEQAAKPYSEGLKAIAANGDLTQEEKRAQTLALLAGAPTAIVGHLQKTHGITRELFPEEKKKTAPVPHKVTTGPNSEQSMYWDEEKGSFVPLGKPSMIRDPNKDGGGNGKMGKAELKALRDDITKSSAEYQRERLKYNEDLKMNLDPEALAAQKATLDEKKAALETKAQTYYAETGTKYLPGGVDDNSPRKGMELVGRDEKGNEVWLDKAEGRPYVSAGMEMKPARTAAGKSSPAAPAGRAPAAGQKPVIRYVAGPGGKFVPQ